MFTCLLAYVNICIKEEVLKLAKDKNKKSITIILEPETHKKLKLAATMQDKTIQNLVEELIKKEVK